MVCALAVFAFLSMYNFDNKYTVKQPHAKNGVLMLDERMLAEYPVLLLINGWEYYGGKLLRPPDFSAAGPPAPDQHIYIGQYGGFEAGDRNASPHGSATYRLTIYIPYETRDYMLELPEIFSAYRAYVNGREVMRMGDPDPGAYRAETGNRSVSFEASGSIEIIIAVSDFSHVYSGMTYPPAFGAPDKVSSLLSARLVIRSLVCAAAVTIALLSLFVGLLSRGGKMNMLYGLLCLCFVGYVSYPILQTFATGLYPLYIIENFSFCAMLLLAMLLQAAYGQRDRWGRYFIWFGALCCAITVIMPMLAPLSNLALLYGYSFLISLYEIIAAGFITFTAIRAIVKKTAPGLALLGGVLIFDCALIMDRLLPLHEPILTGWFIEAASFALVIAIGVIIAQETALKFRENIVLSERANSMERLSEMQRGYFAVLRQEMDETRAMRHDMRHHFMAINGFLKSRKYDDLADYIEKCSSAAFADQQELYSDNNIINILAHHYSVLCKQNRISFDFRCQLDGPAGIADSDLCGLLSNLLENAVEACLRIETGRRFIRLGIIDMGDLVVRVENSTDENLKQSAGAFLSSKGRDRQGYGLASIRATAKRYNGAATFSWDSEERTFTSIIRLAKPGT